MSDNNALAVKVADAVMDAIEHHGRINRDDLIAAAAGAIAQHEIGRWPLLCTGIDKGAGDYAGTIRFIATTKKEPKLFVEKAEVCEKVDLRPGAVHGRINGTSFIEYVTAYEAALEADLFAKAKD